MKNAISFLTILLITNFYSCNTNNMIIDPIDKEFNEQLLTGDGLDSNLFSTKEIVQYYEINNYSDLPIKDFVSKLNQFSIDNYKFNDIKDKNDFTILFYKKETLIDYSKDIYESARDNQNGFLQDYSQNLVVKIRLKAILDSDKVSSEISFYKKDKLDKEFKETIILK